MRKPSGFTLIEVMIAMLIMSMLTLLISTSIRNATKNKRKFEARIASETLLYDCLKILKQDLEKAFNYQDVFFEMEQQAINRLNQEKNKLTSAKSGTSLAPLQKLTHFLGEENSVHFTSLNHFRTRYNSQESNQMEVGYYLGECKNKNSQGKSQCLWRRSSHLIDDRVDEGGTKVILAENVSHFKLSYRDDGESDDWLERWRSDNRGREDHRNRFPNLVKIELKIENKKNPKIKKVEQSVVARIQFPNNRKLLSPQLQNPQLQNANPQNTNQIQGP